MEVDDCMFPFPAFFKWVWDTSGKYFRQVEETMISSKKFTGRE
jgi:hypothetical protein